MRDHSDAFKAMLIGFTVTTLFLLAQFVIAPAEAETSYASAQLDRR